MGASINKLLLEIDGEPLLRRVVRRAIDAGLAPVIVVVGYEPDRIRESLDGLECTFVENRDYSGPTSGSLHAGLRALDKSVSAAVVMLGDMVHVTTAMVRKLLGGLRSDSRLVVSRYGADEVLAPPLLFRRELWPELLEWSGEGCGKAVVKAHLDEAVIFDWPGDALRDIDTPADYEDVRR